MLRYLSHLDLTVKSVFGPTVQCLHSGTSVGQYPGLICNPSSIFGTYRWPVHWLPTPQICWWYNLIWIGPTKTTWHPHFNLFGRLTYLGSSQLYGNKYFENQRNGHWPFGYRWLAYFSCKWISVSFKCRICMPNLVLYCILAWFSHHLFA